MDQVQTNDMTLDDANNTSFTRRKDKGCKIATLKLLNLSFSSTMRNCCASSSISSSLGASESSDNMTQYK